MSQSFVVPTLADLGDPCYRSEQDRYNDYFNKTIWSIPFGIAGVVVSATEPSVEDRDKVWFRIGTDGGLATPVPLVYSTDYSRWVGRHPIQVEDGYASMIWKGPQTSLWAYDGGDGTIGPATATTGPMWDADPDFGDVWPIGIGATYQPTPGLATIPVFDPSGAPAAPNPIGVIFAVRTARIYYTV